MAGGRTISVLGNFAVRINSASDAIRIPDLIAPPNNCHPCQLHQRWWQSQIHDTGWCPIMMVSATAFARRSAPTASGYDTGSLLLSWNWSIRKVSDQNTVQIPQQYPVNGTGDNDLIDITCFNSRNGNSPIGLMHIHRHAFIVCCQAFGM
jgi:hypothetical protein